MSSQTDQPMPILIVAGFLGAGKTTFIRDLLPLLDQSSYAPYVILNDYVNASIDAQSLHNLGAEIKALAAGCVCCEESSSLIDTILRVLKFINPLLIIEANGSTDPYRLIETLSLTPALRGLIHPIMQATIINEARWGKRWLPGDKRTEEAQARTASVILTNRSDKATDKQQAKLREDLAILNPKAPVLDLAAFAKLLSTSIESFTPPDTSEPIPHTHNHVAVQLTPPTMSEERLRQWLVSLPADVLRVKGLARISETEMAYFSRTDDPFESPRIVKATPQAGMEPAVVFIGSTLSRDILAKSMNAPSSAPAPFKISR